MTKKILIDPPSGWRYGYPKELPASLHDASEEDLIDWHLSQGYPQQFINDGLLRYTRYIFIDEEDNEKC